jgi:nucleoside-diphosphate-sugar epimerase
VFVAGASGAIGRSLVPQLVAAGHDVTGTTRSEQRAEMIRAAGARAAICHPLDADALRRAVVDAAPDVVVHEFTALPPRLDPRDKRVYEATNRIRRDGTANLLAAAHAAGARRFICQSTAALTGSGVMRLRSTASRALGSPATTMSSPDISAS